jgi:hypothetical protein
METRSGRVWGCWLLPDVEERAGALLCLLFATLATLLTLALTLLR